MIDFARDEEFAERAVHKAKIPRVVALQETGALHLACHIRDLFVSDFDFAVGDHFLDERRELAVMHDLFFITPHSPRQFLHQREFYFPVERELAAFAFFAFDPDAGIDVVEISGVDILPVSLGSDLTIISSSSGRVARSFRL
jgi:hypothetical protein